LGLILLNWQTSIDELTFIGVVIASVALSAPFVIFDDGWRVLIVTNVFFAGFAVFCLRSPYTQATRPASAAAPLRLEAVLLAMGPILLCGVLTWPAIAYRLERGRPMALNSSTSPQPGEVFISTRLGRAGFLVTPDDAPPPPGVPSLTQSAFLAAARASGIDDSIGKRPLPPPPFAVSWWWVFYCEGDRVITHVFIAPPDLFFGKGDLYKVQVSLLSDRDLFSGRHFYLVKRWEPILGVRELSGSKQCY
jgi:hypothetical protein